jgi:MoaA/NifB/PqqE/SkfB family radical SAM enzyme
MEVQKLRRIQIPLRIFRYRLARARVFSAGSPLVLTFSVTNRCNSRCKTCNIWKASARDSEELNLDEIELIFRSMDKLYFLNLSGGEPFLREDLVTIIRLAKRYLSPNLIHIPSNGLAVDLIERRVKEILEVLSDSKTMLTIKLSLDGVGQRHDEIRGVKGNFDMVMETYRRLSKLREEYPNFHLGINTIISKFNVDCLDEIVEYVRQLKPDSFVTEIAENRSELFNLQSDITPDPETYEMLIQSFIAKVKDDLKYKRSISKFTDASRLVYYRYVIRILKEKRQVLPCYAGISNAHLNPYGDVWPCCVLGYEKSMGNLRDFNYNFKRLWDSEQANAVRNYIKSGYCYCPLANQAYSNMICNITAVLKIAKTMISVW